MEYKNKKFLLNSRPVGMPEDNCWKLVDEKISSLKKSEILIEVKFLSIDPYMRGRMNDGVSYAAPAKIGEPMTGETVGEVVESKSSLYEIGDIVCIQNVHILIYTNMPPTDFVMARHGQATKSELNDEKATMISTMSSMLEACQRKNLVV